MDMLRKSFLALGAALLFVGCGGSDSYVKVGKKHFLSDLSSHMPFPNDLLFLPSAQEPADGTINMPYDPNASSAPMLKALNRLDGFSTTSPIVIPTDSVIDPRTLYDRLKLYKVAYAYTQNSPLPVAMKIEKELQAEKDFSFVTKDNSVVILPKVPLEGNSHYVVAIQRGVLDVQNEKVTPDLIGYLLYTDEPLQNYQDRLSNEILQKIAALRPYYHQLLQAIGMEGRSVALVFGFKTQSIGKIAKALAQQPYQSKLVLQDTQMTSKDMLAQIGKDVSALQGSAEMYAGVLQNVPYYLGIPSKSDPLAPLQKTMKVANGKPVATKRVTIPVLASVPKSCPMPEAGWPVVIFQHGITQNRTNLLAVAESFAKACYAAVAIDLPLHGITDSNSPFATPYERTFGVDYVTQDEECNIVAMQPDGKPDCSGMHYINLANPAISRDNMLQSVADISALRSALENAVGVKFDSTKVAYVGHSLGAMVPFAYLANENVNSAVLANPGGGIIELLMNSQTFGDPIKNALSANGIVPGSEAFAKYKLVAQTLIDDADPINYAKQVAKNQKSLIFETLNDAVIPNSVIGAPLSGTEPLLRVMNAKPVPQEMGFVKLSDKVYYAKFALGTHSSLLVPSEPEVTAEMQREMASFIASGGNGVVVENLGLLAE